MVAALAMATLAFVAHGPALRWIGQALVVEDPLARVDAIVVVAGATPSREEAAARLYRDGLAPAVVLSNQFTPDRVRDLIALGARRFDYQGEARVVLEKHGVPARPSSRCPPRQHHRGRAQGGGRGGACSRLATRHPRHLAPALAPREARLETRGPIEHRRPRPGRPRRRLPRRRLVAQAPPGRSRPPRIPRPHRHLPRHLPPTEIAETAQLSRRPVRALADSRSMAEGGAGGRELPDVSRSRGANEQMPLSFHRAYVRRPRRGQLRGGARRRRARRSLSTLSPPPRAPTKQMPPYRPPDRP